MLLLPLLGLLLLLLLRQQRPPLVPLLLPLLLLLLPVRPLCLRLLRRRLRPPAAPQRRRQRRRALRADVVAPQPQLPQHPVRLQPLAQRRHPGIRQPIVRQVQRLQLRRALLQHGGHQPAALVAHAQARQVASARGQGRLVWHEGEDDVGQALRGAAGEAREQGGLLGAAAG
jgi:hypothetical protein